MDHKLNGRLSSGGSEQSKTSRERFEKWCQTHGVVYGGEEEWMKRFEIYQSNIQYIDSHNALNLPYKLTDNRFADMTHDEINARCCGYKYKKRESDFDSEPGPVTAILEPESELQLNSYQEEEEEEDDVTLDVLSDAEEEAVEEEDTEAEGDSKVKGG